ncbi:unnamed protein product [Spirodela intermedia]|uniref:Uncharacterized protein n=1 Tax=Spirodela intermedia TaxID=51605 RepID=A0A7I8L179_SPIIN|nr:unnamed protein product [Spirodela intermedia]
MPLYYDNQVVIFIIKNPTFHKRMKHIEIDYYYIQDKIMSGVISTPHIVSSHQLANIFIKSFVKISYEVMCTKLGMFNLYVVT